MNSDQQADIFPKNLADYILGIVSAPLGAVIPQQNGADGS